MTHCPRCGHDLSEPWPLTVEDHLAAYPNVAERLPKAREVMKRVFGLHDLQLSQDVHDGQLFLEAHLKDYEVEEASRLLDQAVEEVFPRDEDPLPLILTMSFYG